MKTKPDPRGYHGSGEAGCGAFRTRSDLDLSTSEDGSVMFRACFETQFFHVFRNARNIVFYSPSTPRRGPPGLQFFRAASGGGGGRGREKKGRATTDADTKRVPNGTQAGQGRAATQKRPERQERNRQEWTQVVSPGLRRGWPRTLEHGAGRGRPQRGSA